MQLDTTVNLRKNNEKITSNELLFEIMVIIKDYFECENKLVKNNIILTFANNQKFAIKIDEIIK